MSISNITYNGFNAGIANKYPYTDFHEMNLDWILTNYQAIIDKLNETIAWCNTHQTEYEEAMRRLQAVENEIYTFEQQINDAFARLEQQISADVELALADIRTEVSAAIRQMQQEVTQQLADFVVQFQQLKSEVQAEINRLLGVVNRAIADLQNQLAANNEQAEINRLLAIVNRAIADLQNQLEANNQFVFEYVENRLEEFKALIPDYENIYVYNPYRGEVTHLQQAINDLYSVASIWGLTAAQYDSLGLTADEYDNMNLSAIEYDTLGFKLLYKDPDLYMFSPFTGQMESLKSVILSLVGLHREDALTAQEYDDLALDADAYDAYQVEAFDYDFSGKTILV